MLGYKAGQPTLQSQFGSVPSIFAMDNVNCIGNETSLLDCTHLTEDNCGPTEGAGVICCNIRKGSFHLRFSGIRPLRGGVPPFSAKEKNLLFFTLILR